VIRNFEGRGDVVIRRICEDLEIDFSDQLQKLKRESWAGVEIISIPDARGVEQEAALIPWDKVPTWMINIGEGRVAERLRPELRQDARPGPLRPGLAALEDQVPEPR
jgi:hypothetical protein